MNKTRPTILLLCIVLLAPSCAKEASAKSPPSQAGQAMLTALNNSDVAAVRAALDGGEPADAHERGKPLVVLAAAGGLTDVVGLLLDRGARIEAATELGITPLFAAVMSGKSHCARMLIDRGADVNAANSAGSTILMMATSAGDEQMALHLLEKGADGKAASKRNQSTALMLAAGKDMNRLLQALVATGVDVGAVDAIGNTAMSYARSDAARAILADAGADAATEAADPDARGKVREVFANYQRAVGESRDDAGSMVSRATAEMFVRWRDAALRADRVTLRQRPIHEQFGVLRLRAEFPAERLENMSGEQLVTVGIQNGWVDKDSTAAMQLGEIRVAGHAASSEVERNGQPTGVQFSFVKEDDGWKIDLSQSMAAGEVAIQSVLGRFDGSQEQRLVSLLGETTGKNVDDGIWQPLRQ
jgi:hypothetical protein